MNRIEVENVSTELLEKCFKKLEVKGREYSYDEDRLSFFKQDIIPDTRSKNFLFNMALKHIKSIYDMTKLPIKESVSKTDLWEEKITDLMCYLMLLWCLVVEDRRKSYE